MLSPITKEALRKVGRPKGPDKVIYKRRVCESVVRMLDDIVYGKGASGCDEVSYTVPESQEPEKAMADDINKLLDNIVLLEREKERLHEQIEVLQAGLTDTYVQSLRARVKVLEGRLRQLEAS